MADNARKSSDARIRASVKWQKNNVDLLKVLARKEEGATIRAYIERHGMGITEFFLKAAEEYMANHG